MNLLRFLSLLEAMAALVGLIFVIISYVSYRLNGKGRGYFINKSIGLALIITASSSVLLTHYFSK